MWNKILDFVGKLLVSQGEKSPAIAWVKKDAPMIGYVDYGYKAGELTKKYETSNRGPGYISTGMGGKDPGGISYGSYQLETKKGTMQEYLKGNDKYINELKKHKVNSLEFQQVWKQLAAADPEGFEQSQFDYLAHKPNGYYDGIDYARHLGWNVNNLAMQSAIFSTVNQSGGWREGIFNNTRIKPTDSLEVQINKLYDARANYFKSLKLDSKVKQSILKNRTVDERADCLKMITEQLF